MAFWLTMGLELPNELTKRYRGEAYIARMPFLLNSYLETGKVMRELSEKKIGEKDLFVGIPGFRSLDMIAATQGAQPGYRQAVLFDMNMTQVKAMNAVMVLINEARSPEEFIRLFAPKYDAWLNTVPRQGHPQQTPEDRRYFAVHGREAQPKSRQSMVEHLEEEMYNPRSWLFIDNFPKIKKMVAEGRIATAVMDLRDDRRVGVFRQWMKDEGLRAGDMYISSSLVFMDPWRHFDYYGKRKTDDSERFLRNLLSVADGETGILYSMPVPPDVQQEQHSEPFILSRAIRPAFERLLSEWQVEKPSSPLEKKYQYVFQAGQRALQIGTASSDNPPQGAALLEITAEKIGLEPAEALRLRRALAGAGVTVVNGRGLPGDSVVFYARPHDLENPEFFAHVAAIARAAMREGPQPVALRP